MSTQQTTPQKQQEQHSHCENCGVLLHGIYCHACGQPRQTSFRFFGTILMDLLDNLISYDSRVYRTLIPLMTRPGFVCLDYLSGRRASYLPPFRLYLFASIIFFLLAPLGTNISYSNDSAEIAPEVTTIIGEDIPELESLKKDDVIVNISDLENEVPDNKIDLPFLSDKQNNALLEKFEKSIENNAEDLINATLNNLPTMMFFLLPVFAFTLKLFYLFSNRYYMEHVIVVLYSQSYLFFMLLFVLGLDRGHDYFLEVLPSWVIFHTICSVFITLCYNWIPIHIFLIQKRVYGQSITMTLIKFIAVALTYFSLLGITIAAATIWGVVNI
jgi:Protein of unknown function (DUF3667)